MAGTFPIRFASLNVSLDPGWVWGINYGAARHLPFGRAINFTYGPLGYLLVPMDVGSHVQMSLAFWAGAQTVLALVLWRRLRHGATVPGLVVFAALWLFGTALGFQPDHHLTMIIGLLLIHTLDAPPGEARAAAIAAGVLAGAAPFMKFTFGVAAGAMLVIAFALWIARRGTQAWRDVMLTTAAYLVVAAVTVVVYIRSAGSFAQWLRTSLEISNGYSGAMSSGPARLAFAGIAGLAIFAAVVVASRLAKSSSTAALLIFAPVVFVVFKHAYTRHGGRYFAPFLVLVLSVLVLHARRRMEIAIAAVSLSMIGAFLVVPGCRHDPGKTAPCAGVTARAVSGRDGLSRVSKSVHLSRTLDELAELSGRALRADVLPPAMAREIARGATVDALPWEVAYMPANGFDWSPNPVLQTYEAYTRYLDARSAEHYLGPDAPDYLIVRYGTLNNRHFLLDQEATWRAVIDNYTPVVASKAGSVIVFRKNGRGSASYAAVRREVARSNKWIDVPAPSPGKMLFARADMKLTTAGQLRRLLFRTEPVFVDLVFETGETRTHRIVPETMEHGFVIGAVPRTLPEFAAFFEGATPQRVVQLRIRGAGAKSYRAEIPIVWEERDALPRVTMARA